MSSFVGRYKKDWSELESLLKRGRKSARKLSPEERQRLDVLYRRTTVQLARVTTSSRDRQLIAYLNGLAAAAHSLIYLPPRGRALQRAIWFVKEGFGRAIVRNGRAHLISLLLLIGGGVMGYVASASDPMTAHALWPAQDPRQPGSTPEQLLEVLRANRDEGGGSKFLFASFLFQHNFKVGLLAMATGILAGIPSIFLMILNGMLLGVFVAIHLQAGIRSEMWAWILPHGVTELGAIVLCGGIGLMLGRAVVRPGLLTRRQSLMLAGREASQVAIGIGGMLIAAALIESYVRQSHWETSTRLIFAGGTALFWAGYIGWGALRERQERLAASPEDQPGTWITAGSAAAVQ